MSENIVPIQNIPDKRGCVKPFCAWFQKTLPAVYDDGMSYFEMLSKVVDSLNSVIESTNGITSDFNNMIDLYKELYNYVVNYFNNLDVQEEIDNKIDSMVEDGTLDSIFGRYYIKKGEIDVQRDINVNLSKITENMLSDELIEAISGDGSVEQIPADGSVTTSKLADKSVTAVKLKNSKASDNLLSAAVFLDVVPDLSNNKWIQVENPDNTLSIAFPLDYSTDPYYTWSFDYMNDVLEANRYLRFLSALPSAESSTDNILQSVTFITNRAGETQASRITVEGTKYVYVLAHANQDTSFTVNEALENIQFFSGCRYVDGYTPPFIGDIPDNWLSENVQGATEWANSNEIGVYISDSKDLLTVENNTTDWNIRYSDISDCYDRFRNLINKYNETHTVKATIDIIGYGSTPDGIEDTNLPINRYTIKPPLTRYIDGQRELVGGIDRTLLITGCTHGNEKNSLYAIYRLLKVLVEGNNPYVNGIFDMFNIEIVPIINPGGFNDNTRTNRRGVNINRNFSPYWDEADTDEGGENYKGPYPESESETRAMANLFRNNVGKYAALLDAHCSVKYGGDLQFMFQIYTDSKLWQRLTVDSIAKANTIWKRKYGWDIREVQYNNGSGSTAPLTQGLGDLPQMSVYFNEVNQTELSCEIEAAKIAYVQEGLVPETFWYGYPTPQIAEDGLINTLIALVNTIDRSV